MEEKRISANPDDYQFRGIAVKSDSAGEQWWTWIGPVMCPLDVDTQDETVATVGEKGDIQAHEEIRRAAHEWFRGDRATKVDTNHNYTESGVHIVESAVAEEPYLGMRPGTWFVRAFTHNKDIGEKVDRGELNAFSWAGPVTRNTYLTLVSHACEGSGTTEKCDAGPYPEHDHELALKFDDAGKVIPTRTGMRFAHQHEVSGTTRTESTDGHAHPMLIVR